jgi:hypothetical protein
MEKASGETLSFRVRQEPKRGKTCGIIETPNRSYLYTMLSRYPGLVIELEAKPPFTKYLTITVENI